MIPFKKQAFYPSLIISEEKIQVIELDASGKRIIRLAEERLEPQVIKAGMVGDSDKLSQSLKKLFKTANITRELVVVGIPENKCYTKVLDLPKLKMDELEEAVSWEADTYLPVESDQVYMDWRIIEATRKDNIRVLLIAVPKEIIDGYTSALKSAGLTPVAYETTALSLIRLIETQNIRMIVMEIQEKHAVLTLTKGSAIEASSIVAFTEQGGGKGFDHLVQTTKEMISFYEEKRRDEDKIQKIFICGERAGEAVRKELADETGREVAFSPVPIENLPKGREQGYAVVASLAKKDIESPKDEYTINLLPPTIQEEFDSKREEKLNRRMVTITTAVIASLTLASLITFMLLVNSQRKLDAEKLGLSPLPVETGKMVEETARLNHAVATIVKVGSGRVFPEERITSLLSNVPEGISISLILVNENQRKIQVTGRAVTRQDMLNFRNNLENSQEFSEPILPLSSLQQSENVDFVITASVN